MSYNFQTYDNYIFTDPVEIQLFMESLAHSGYSLIKSLSSYEVRTYSNATQKIILNVPEKSVSIVTI